ncbi:hypothetical protein SPI_04685 [Niveomyces insectorum RCEF 264]|uniref:Uncharacterized protein n=1 Tax=Niveomyces insectorum RCEF 264 TaxID=1081102 RepID=A0A167URC4_9HYPO|nr:hypothetical protein SPI_04685 [Niveomyces insectorum RCEF 264]
MSKSGSIVNYWKPTPASPSAPTPTDTQKPSTASHQPPCNQPPAPAPPHSSSPSFLFSRAAAPAAASSSSRPNLRPPASAREAIVISSSSSGSSTPCRNVKTSPESPVRSPDFPGSLGSTDSFPASPFHTNKAWPVSSSPPASSPKQRIRSHGGVIRDSDDDSDDDISDGLDGDSEGNGCSYGRANRSAASLEEAVRLSQPLRTTSSATTTYTSCYFTVAPGFAAMGKQRAPTSPLPTSSAPSSPHANGTATPPPLSKRRANTLLVSPLPLRRAKHARVSKHPNPPPPLRHKFDMEALLRHAEQDDATDAAARRASAAFASGRGDDRGSSSRGRQTAIPPSHGGSAKPTDGKHAAAAPFDVAAHMPLLGGLLDDDDNDNDNIGRSSGRGSTKDDTQTRGGDRQTAGLASFNKERLIKAFDRTELAAVSEQWYFFKEYFVPSPRKRRLPFPEHAVAAATAGGDNRWTFLQDTSMRQDYFSMGIVRRALSAVPHDRLQSPPPPSSSDSSPQPSSQPPSPPPPPTDLGLPEELFLWILNETCVEPLPSLRAEYAAILRCCPGDQVRRLVDTECLLRLFQTLGPRWESIDLSARLALVPAIQSPYPGRDWSPLRALLRLLACLANMLPRATVACAAKLLIRLGIDKVVEDTPDVLQDYQDAVRALVLCVPAAEWVDFCYDVALCLHTSVQKPALRWQVLACLPFDAPACHDLRRRLAAVCLLDDPTHARQDPRCAFCVTTAEAAAATEVTATATATGAEAAATMTKAPGPLARLAAARADLAVAAGTNYADLAALVNFLDVYVDDAGRSRVTVASTSKASASASASKTSIPSSKQFDADVDALALRLKTLGQSIVATGGGHVSRLDSKTAFERVQIRLTHTVRTKRPTKASIFDRLGRGGGANREGADGDYDDDDDEALRPKQRDIRSFFKQQMAKRAGAQQQAHETRQDAT